MKPLQATALASFLAAASYTSSHANTPVPTEANNMKAEILYDDRKNKKRTTGLNFDHDLLKINGG